MQYALISTTDFVYLTHPGPLIIPDGMTAHANYNMWIAHTEEVRLFCKVTGVEQSIVQIIVGMVDADYLADTYNRETKSINDSVAGVLTHLEENYGQLMPHKLLEREDIVKKIIYNPCDPIATVFSSVKELLEFYDITETSYTQFQAINIAYVILHRTSKFRLAICKWNCMPEVQKA